MKKSNNKKLFDLLKTTELDALEIKVLQEYTFSEIDNISFDLTNYRKKYKCYNANNIHYYKKFVFIQ
jgi:hypothetical protein